MDTVMNAELQKPLVLVVDDEVNTTLMIQHIFEREGYRVERVMNGLDALDAAKNLSPDLILLDILMPGMNGFEVLQQLREDVETVNIPTIMITANAREPKDVARGMNLGADDYVYKPFAPQELLARAQSKIRARQLEDALQSRTRELEALLRFSDELNVHLQISEVLDLIPHLVLQLLPGDLAIIQTIDESGALADARAFNRTNPETNLSANKSAGEAADETALYTVLQSANPIIWPQDPPLLAGFPNGMAVRVRHDADVLGLLIVASRTQAYDERQLRLFEGIAHQAGLALRNAQLYAIQANYALHLEDMVEERTAELRNAQQMLVRSEKLAAIGHLAASIAHEINNPLMPIGNLLESLVEELTEQNIPLNLRDIEIIQESLERIRRIVARLLEFSRDTDGELQPLDVGVLLESVIKLNRKYFEHERIEIAAEMEPTPLVFGSKDQLEAVFMNLALNAQAAMAGGGKLVVATHPDQEQVVIEFRDNGCGIPQDKIGKIFDPFFSTKTNGTGLGLFVSYGVIEGHQGTIEVDSEEGVGTCFTIRLPAYADGQ
ncbi:MAG: response regulator [Chloroflexi bacterium]|nr:response regulator [Chloroflexota bacterium]